MLTLQTISILHCLLASLSSVLDSALSLYHGKRFATLAHQHIVAIARTRG